MKTRVISGAILVVIMISCMVLGVFGGYSMFALALFVSAYGLYELYHTVDIHKNALGVVGYFLCAVYYVITFFHLDKYLFAFMVGGGLLIMFVYVLDFKHKSLEQAALTVLGIYYVVIPLSFIYRIYMLQFPKPVTYNGIEISYGVLMFIMTFFCTWGSDTFAYLVGRKFGKHKLAPDISPNKTIEGAIGGAIGAGILGAILGLVAGFLTLKLRLAIAFMSFGVIGSVISVFGDLSASAIKRRYGIKDFSHLIPGHGGILDRFDSLIFVAPVVYTLSYFFTTYLYDI